MKQVTALLIAVLLPGVIALSSCAPPLEKIEGFSHRWQFYDIEVPDYCDYIERDSWTYIEPQWPSFRIGHGQFEGPTRRDVVAHRYRKVMANHGYTLLKDLSSDALEETTLRFYHSIRDEIAEISIRHGDKNLIYVDVDVKPKP